MRVVFAILVVMIHLSPFGDTGTNSLIDYLTFAIQHYLARLAVPFFFVTSGFFLYKKTNSVEFNLVPSKKYCIHTIRLYIIWSIIYFPLLFRSFFVDEKGFVYAVLRYIRNFLFTGSYLQLWYLNALVVAVSIVSFLLYKKINPIRMVIVAAALYFIGLFAQSWYGFIIPIKTHMPTIWMLLKSLKKVIVTTRNGVFFGFLFVAIGMCFAFYSINISRKKALQWFMISIILMFFETFILQYSGVSKGHDMYFFLVPTTFFLFALVKEIKLPDSNIFKTLRALSSLIYFLHMWVIIVVGKILRIIDESLSVSFVRFPVTLVITIFCAFIILFLSEKPKFKWLKNLY